MRIALIAHDSRKELMAQFCTAYLRILSENELVATGVTGKITSAPAKHLATLCNQMVNFLGIMQNEWAGAQAFSSFDTYLAPFVKCDNMSYDAVKKCIESFIYGVNTPSRWGTHAEGIHPHAHLEIHRHGGIIDEDQHEAVSQHDNHSRDAGCDVAQLCHGRKQQEVYRNTAAGRLDTG
mgnify:CR=1 FL=1